MFRHLSTRNISYKSMHAFLSNFANTQTEKQTLAKTCTSSFVLPQLLTHKISSNPSITSLDIPLKFKKSGVNPAPGSELLSGSGYDSDPAHNLINSSKSRVYRHIKFYQNSSISSSDIPLKLKNPV